MIEVQKGSANRVAAAEGRTHIGHRLSAVEPGTRLLRLGLGWRRRLLLRWCHLLRLRGGHLRRLLQLLLLLLLLAKQMRGKPGAAHADGRGCGEGGQLGHGGGDRGRTPLSWRQLCKPCIIAHTPVKQLVTTILPYVDSSRSNQPLDT